MNHLDVVATEGGKVGLETQTPRDLPCEETDFALDVYASATRLAISRNQTTGEKHDYYITLFQLESIIQRVPMISSQTTKSASAVRKP